MNEPKTHDFLAEELLIPAVNHNDLSRINMFTNHITQAVVLNNPESPLVFTNFENQIGEISSAYIEAKDTFKIVKVLARNPRHPTIIAEYTDGPNKGKAEVIQLSSSTNLTEKYGYLNNIPTVEDLESLDTVDKGTIISSSTSYDETMNFMYGTNLKTVYYAYKGLTFEDGIVISESAAQKLATSSVENFLIPVNTNDILLNLYGDSEEFKCIPSIGESITGGILCARRRMVNAIMLYSLNDEALQKIFSTDNIYYGEGEIDDVFVYCNRDTADITDPSMAQFKDILLKQEAYDTELVNVLTPYRDADMLMPDAAYAYTRAYDSIDKEFQSRKKWLSENSFDNMVIKIRVVHSKPIVQGSKITNRYGGKGVVSCIVPDDQMPKTETGEYAEVCLNPLGVINRINPGALFELEINAMVKQYRDRFKSKPYAEQYDAIKNILLSLNYDQYVHFESYVDTLDDDAKAVFVNDLIETGINIHVEPFFNDIDLELLGDIRDNLEYQPTKFEGVETPMTFGEMYFIRLKHEPKSKHSARSCGQINQKGVPTKTNRAYKQGLSPYSNTPVRVGEQELENLLLINDNEAVYKYLDCHSSSKTDRESLIKALLTKQKGDTVKVESGSYSTVKEVLKAYMSVLGLKLEK